VAPVLATIVAAVIGLSYTAAIWRAREVDHAHRELRHATSLISSAHAHAVHDARQTLNAIAAASELAGPELEAALRAGAERGDGYVNLGVADAAGRVIRAHRDVEPGLLALLPGLAQRAAGTRRFVTDRYVIDAQAQMVGLVAAEPAATPSTRVAFGIVDMRWLGDAVAGLPAGAVYTVLDGDGRIVARGPGGVEWIGRIVADDAFVRSVLAQTGDGVTRATSFDGIAQFVAYALLPNAGASPWFVTVALPAAAVTAATDRTVWRTIAILVFATLAALGLCWIGWRRVATDVEALVGTAERLRGGDTSTAVATQPIVLPELALLSSAIGGMAATVVKREQETAQRHDELARDDRRLRAVMETAIGRVVIFDVDGTVLYASPSSVRMGGYYVDEIVGRRRFEFVHLDDREMLRTRFDEVLRTPGGAFTATFRLQTHPGSWRWIECEITNMLHEQRVHAMVGKYRDVTELREAEDERRRMQAELELHVRERTAALTEANQALHKLSRAIEQTADSVFVTDRHGVIEYVNPAFEEMTGYSSAEVVGNTPRMMSSGLHDKNFYANLWETILSGKVFRAVVTNKRKDGRLFNEDQSITPIRDADGVITNFISTGRDITERRRTEAALRRLNAALEDEAARIASVLHDEAGQFLSSAHITLADVARELAPEQRSRVQQVRHHLDLAEEQLRRVSHELHPRILDDLGLAEAVRFLTSGFGRRTGISVDVEVSIASFCPRTIETVLYRLVQEGLTNIGKHAHATRVSIILARERARILCSIHDDGVGFDATSVVEEPTGFSLGLTLMRDRLEAVGGTLTILSAPQRGTELRAIVPVEG
jgi:two-component system, NarL family, sensor histidine kinase NreB